MLVNHRFDPALGLRETRRELWTLRTTDTPGSTLTTGAKVRPRTPDAHPLSTNLSSLRSRVSGCPPPGSRVGVGRGDGGGGPYTLNPSRKSRRSVPHHDRQTPHPPSPPPPLLLPLLSIIDSGLYFLRTEGFHPESEDPDKPVSGSGGTLRPSPNKGIPL